MSGIAHAVRTRIPFDRIALTAILILPLALLHARAVAELAVAVIGLCFLTQSALTRDWAWTRTPWLLIGWVWYGWEVICSLPIPALSLGEGGLPSLGQALAVARFLIFLAALEHYVLRPETARRYLRWAVSAAAAYIGLHAAVQFVTGYNLYGIPRIPGGELTGPFVRPRAGAPFVRILLPSVVPWAANRLNRPGLGSALIAWSLPLLGIVIALLMSQRMPVLLLGLGLAVVGLLLPRFRWGVAAAGVAVAVLLVASPVISPQMHHRLISQFSGQLAHFPVSDYGKLYTRAIEVAVRNPLTGLGAEGFRTGCEDPKYFRPSFDGSLPDGGGKEICWHHPHQYYLEAWDIGGYPGLILFAALCLAWMITLGRGLWRHPDPLRASLFAAALMTTWPIASSTGFTTMPVAGWAFLLLGWGLAEARWQAAKPSSI